MIPSTPPDRPPSELPNLTLPALLEVRAAASPNAIAQWRASEENGWLSNTWAEYRDVVARLVGALDRLGLEAGDRVGIMSSNSERWDWVSMAIMAARGVVVGIDPYATESQVAEIASRSGLVALVARDTDTLAKFDTALLSSLKFCVLLSDRGANAPKLDRRMILFPDLLALGTTESLETWDRSVPDDPAILIFTSGTTGSPKGIVYRHNQVCLAVDSILAAFVDVREGSRLISWLPLSNIFQRVVNLCAIVRGAQTYYVEDPKEILRRLPEIQPDVFIGVPRFFEKQYAGIADRLNRLAKPIRVLADMALRVGDACARARRGGTEPDWLTRSAYLFAEALLLRQIRGIVWGGRLRYLISGSAPMPVWLLERLHALGLPVLEAYGMSECIVPVSSNRPGAYKFGSVGRPMQGNEIRLGDDGELLLRGPGVFDGYCDAEESDSPVDAEGFLASGDFAAIDDEGYISLTGRKSEIFKTSTGRRVAPVPIEALLRSLPYVEDAALYGASRKSLVAVVWLSSSAPAGGGDARAGLPERLRSDVEAATQALPAYLRPTGVVVTRRPFTIEGGELTANLKLRRHAVEELYGGWIDQLYADMEDASVPKPFQREVDPGMTEIISL